MTHDQHPPTERSTLEALPAERLEAEIINHGAVLARRTYELLLLVGELDARGTWARWGAWSCASWLAEACDLDLATARTHVLVARALRTHHALDQQRADALHTIATTGGATITTEVVIHVTAQGNQLTDGTLLQTDHIKPYNKGGPTTLANLQLLCGPHNRAKGG